MLGGGLAGTALVTPAYEDALGVLTPVPDEDDAGTASMGSPLGVGLDTLGAPAVVGVIVGTLATAAAVVVPCLVFALKN